MFKQIVVDKPSLVFEATSLSLNILGRPNGPDYNVNNRPGGPENEKYDVIEVRYVQGELIGIVRPREGAILCTDDSTPSAEGICKIVYYFKRTDWNL